MGTNDLTRFPAGSQDKGVNTFEPDIGPEVTWDETTYNVSGGIRRGVGVRPGMAPLPGHADTETPTSGQCNGLRKSEGATGDGLVNRELIFGIVPLKIAPYTGSYPKANQQFYAYLVGLDNSSSVCLDICFGATKVGSTYRHASDIRAGLSDSSYREESPLQRRHKTELLNLPQTATPTASDMKTTLTLPSSRYWLPYANMSISGKRVPYQWMLGDIESDGDGSNTPTVCLWTATATSPSTTIYCGAPSETITREFVDNAVRAVSYYCLDANAEHIDIQYDANVSNSNISAVAPYDTSPAYASVSATKTGASTSYSSVEAVLINDPASFTNSRHEAILLAGSIPLAAVYQDWLPPRLGLKPRWIDLSSPGCVPRLLSNTTFSDGRPLSMPRAVAAQGAANSGVLRLGSTYDFGFSIYNKLLDYETNVEIGSTHTVTTDDNVAICFDQLGGGDDSVWENFNGSSPNYFSAFPWDFSPTNPSGISPGYNARGLSLNDYEYRLYYREHGTNEWLPGGSYDASQYWFYCHWDDTNPYFCTGPVANLPGGQPNGFVDYSPLPKQSYICVLVYKNRAFWWSEKSMHFSLSNNVYAYPTRNIASVPAGAWRGGIVHIQPGETEQTSRLVIFSSQAAFVGRFTGNRLVQSVRVSSEAVGQFELDGSDFELDYLCDATAYSYRAAVVAEGVLYWWGPQGIYRDDGISRPMKGSQTLEPDIYTLVDNGRIDEIHAVYNKHTKEIYWFYPPKDTDATYPTHALVYNVLNDRVYFAKFRCQVDSAQNIKLESDTTPDAIDGERVILHCRETSASTISRSYFFDELCKSGEQGPAREMVVKSVSSPTSSTRTLTLGAGYPTLTGNIAAGDLIAVPNAKAYATSMTDSDDMICKVTSFDNGAGTITVTVPDGASFDATVATLDPQLMFPIYHCTAANGIPSANGFHGYPFRLQTNYWMPAGIHESWHWLYLFLLFKYMPWASVDALWLELSYRSLQSLDFKTDNIKLEDNSDGHCQLHHALSPGANGYASGQALKYRVSGIHIGHEWTLEYLEAHCTLEDGFILKQFHAR